MSNPDFAGPYWQDQRGSAGRDAGRAAGRDGSARDRGDRPWRGTRARQELGPEPDLGAAGPAGRPGARAGRDNGRGRGANGHSAPSRAGAAGRAAANGYESANGHGAGDGYAAPDRYSADGYSSANGYSWANGYGGASGYAAPAAGSAAGLRERAIDRTGIRARLASRHADPRYGPGGSGGGPGGGPPGRRQGKPRRRGSWWRHWTWRKAAAIVAAACAAVLLIVIVGLVILYQKTVIPNEISEAALQQSSVVYFSNGTTRVGTFDTGTNRQLLTSAQIPQVLEQAVIAAEDRHFYSEGGISVTGIARAAYEDIFGSGGLQGGSTITEQFAKNYYSSIGTSRTMSTKLKEILVAIKLSHEKSKQWILTNYLNTIFLGDDSYGVGAAAETYFGKPAGKLDIAQSAMLAAMINQPGFFDPTPHTPGYAPLVARWHYVLGNMVRDGAITQQQENAVSAHGFPKLARGQQSNGWTGYRGYVMQAVELELENRYHYTQAQIYSRGLKIVTTFSQPMMRALYQSVRENKQAMRNGGVPLYKYANIGAILEKPGTGAITAMYGGPNYAKRQLNMATQSRNQVGSSFKPYVLATAVHEGMNVRTSILDGYAAICAPDDQFPMVASVRVAGPTSPCPTSPPDGWYNFSSGEADGPVSVAQASALSLNTAYGDLIHRVGTQNVIDMAKQFGVNTADYPAGSGLQHMLGQSGIALGQASLTVEEQANTFAALAADGEYATPHVISKITTSTGAQVPLKIVKYPVLTPGEAADVDYALSFDTIYGTATNAAMTDGRPIIGKTGTTNNAQSAFFIGAIPQYSFAVGIFTNKQTETLNGLGGQAAGGYGGTWPALIWHTFAEKEFAQLPIKPLPTPPFAGSKWVQVTVVPVHHHHHASPSPSPSPSPSCTPAFGQQPCPSPSPSPSPSRSASCIQPFGCRPRGR